MNPGGIVIEVEHVGLERGRLQVLHDVSCSFAAGRVSALVGPSGSGKSSLLRCVNRLEMPNSGRVLFEGRDVATIDPLELRKRVGMIFQTPVLFEGGVRANLAYALGDVPEEVLAGALRRVGLDPDFLARSSSALSVGQAQRVCIARALLREPEVLLMDEPTSALDKDATRRIEELIAEISGGGVTTILVTHDLDQAGRVAAHAFLMRAGRIVGSGDPRELEAMWVEDA